MEKKNRQRTAATFPPLQIGYALLVVVCIFLVAGGLAENERLNWLSGAALALLSGATLWGLSPPVRKFETTRRFLSITWHCGVLTLAWMLYRFFAPILWQTGLLPVMTLGYLLASRSLKDMALPLGAVGVMELGLYLSSSQSFLSFAASMTTVLFLVVFLSPIVSPRISLLPRRTKLSPVANQRCEVQKSAYQEPSFLKTVNENITSENAVQLALGAINNLFELGRQQLKAATIALLWPTADGSFTIRQIATDRNDLLQGPFAAGSGLIAGLAQSESITIATPRADGPRLPFYRDNVGLSAIYLQNIRLYYQESEGGVKKQLQAILTVDFSQEKDFDDAFRTALRLFVNQLQLTLDIEKSMRMLALDRDRIQTVCDGLYQLNGVLGLDSVYVATAKIVRGLVPFDLMAISLLQGDKHRIVKIFGRVDSVEEGEEFDANDGLIGQVLKRNHWLPAGASYREAAPIFSNKIKHDSFHSLLILPLRNGDNAPLGTLTVAAFKAKAITLQRRDMLEVVAAQVAVKIDLAQAHEKINQLATIDGLTNLSNHRTFQHGFNMMLERTKRNQCPLCLILCDIDHFKTINDSYGHPFGDKVLKSVAGVLARAVRKVDLAARYGGEEFAVLVESADEQGGRQLAERIRGEIEKLTVSEGRKKVKVTLSLGLSFFPKDAAEKEQLISYADQALYKAKAAGRNRTVAWSEIKGEGPRD